MRILVISDTHISGPDTELPSVIEEEAKKSDYCLHCGDFTNFSLYETLNSWTKTYGVCGNMDDDRIRSTLPLKNTFEINGVHFGLIHGRGNPMNILNYVDQQFSMQLDKLNIIVFGHSHCPLDKEINKRIYFNPGSPTDYIFSTRQTYGILEIESGNLKRRLVEIE